VEGLSTQWGFGGLWVEGMPQSIQATQLTENEQ